MKCCSAEGGYLENGNLGSDLPFAALRTNVCCADKADLCSIRTNSGFRHIATGFETIARTRQRT
jgi:hypothetical protein